MVDPFIIYIKNKLSQEFEYRNDVISVVPTYKGYGITFRNGKKYNYGADKIDYYPHISTRENVCIYENGKLHQTYNTVDNYGRYLIFRREDTSSLPIENGPAIEICDINKDPKQAESVIDYFREILQQSGGVSFDMQSDEEEGVNPNQISSEMLLKALDEINLLDTRSALSKYLKGINPSKDISKKTLIYPFGCNESQKLAVETTLSNSISIIEGPPGTGKTQTVLNIIANLIIENKTVAIVSNNNSAIFNIRDKFAKYGYGNIVASLGNNDNKVSFFSQIETQTIDPDFEVSQDRLQKAKDEIRELDAILTQCFRYRNKLSKLKTELSETQIELNHIQADQPLNLSVKSILDKKFYQKWTYEKALTLMNILSKIELKNRLSLKAMVQFIWQYGLFGLHAMIQYREELHTYINHRFYELYIQKIEQEILDIENWLAANKEESNFNRFIENSKEVFNGVLFKKYHQLPQEVFSMNDYRNRFAEFTQYYPVILSSTLSLYSSIPNDFLFDYLIIDESSQVDIIKAAVCFSCCRNVVVVGDSMQLTHIVDPQSKAVADLIDTEYNITSAYNYVQHNILNSIKSLYGIDLKSVLLREHYRCHPTIIGFCNKKYYDNKLVVMTERDNCPFRIIETSISGGRDHYNQRQIDETDLFIRENYADDYTKVGVIAPYRQHADKLQEQLPPGVESDTIHKFQGREKEVIIFNTVKNKINNFIDNPHLINVAVSRAVNEFIIVKPASLELPHGTNIGDMVRYISYTTDTDQTIVKGRVCSVFDLLYKEYNIAFTNFLASNSAISGSAAEMIVDKLLTERILFNNPQFLSVDMVREYRLRDLIRDFTPYSEEELNFIKSNSRLDFLLYNKIDKAPILAIEVDGVSFHTQGLQQERDNKKNRILDIIGLPLLRLSTDGYNEEGRIIERLSAAMGLDMYL